MVAEGTVAAILLAAGESTRMGRPKPLLPWGDIILVEYQIHQLREGGASPIIAVLGHEAEKVEPYVTRARAKAVVNRQYLSGRASSVRVGAGALPPEAAAVVVLNVDQPRSANLIASLIAAHLNGEALITVPVYQGRRGHPTVFSRHLFPELAQVEEATLGLRDVMRRFGAHVQEVALSSPLVLLDINTPEDYKRAKETLGIERGSDGS